MLLFSHSPPLLFHTSRIHGLRKESNQHAQLLINASPEMAQLVGTHGVHLNSERLLAAVERPLSRELWVAASCHTLAEIEQANRIGVDFMVLGPVRTTASHPDTPPLG